jgi:hypothetical protein
VVDVEQQQRAGDGVTPPPFDLVSQSLAEAAAVGEAGQVVAVGLRA